MKLLNCKFLQYNLINGLLTKLQMSVGICKWKILFSAGGTIGNNILQQHSLRMHHS